MGNIIHMETEAVRDTARRLDQATVEMSDQIQALKSRLISLNNNWTGGDAQAFNRDSNTWLSGFGEDVSALETLSNRARDEVNEWESVDGAHNFNIPAISSSTTPGVGSGEVGTGDSTRINYEPIRTIVDAGSDAVDLVSRGGTLYLPPYDGTPALPQLPTWLGPILQVVSIGITVGATVANDIREFSDPKEREAAIILDLAFEALIFALKHFSQAAGFEMIRDGVGAALTGVFVGPGILTAVLGGALWIGGEIAANLLSSWYYSSSVRESLIQAVAQKL